MTSVIRWISPACPECGGDPVAASEPAQHGRLGTAKVRCERGHTWPLSWRSDASTTARLVRYLHAAVVCGDLAARMEREGRGLAWEAEVFRRAARRLPVLAGRLA